MINKCYICGRAFIKLSYRHLESGQIVYYCDKCLEKEALEIERDSKTRWEHFISGEDTENK